MREILFKAKRLDNGEWVEGYPIFNPDMSRAKILSFARDLGDDKISFYHYAVESSTVCQYTGLTDKNGVKIFEGDVIKYEENTTHTVKFVDGMFICDGFYDSSFDTPWDAFSEGTSFIEVTGNIHDNA